MVLSTAESTPIKPEIRVLSEAGFIFPPTGITVYLTSPYSFPESIFLYLIRERLKLDKTDILFLSYGEDFDTILRTSSVQTPLVRSYRDTMEEPLVHYRFCDTREELLRRFELHYRNHNFIYVYATDPRIPYEEEWASTLHRFVRRIRDTVTRRFLLTIFLDTSVEESPLAKRLLYAADTVFKLEEREMLSGGSLRILKSKMYFKPPLNIEYTVTSTNIEFQILRVLR